MYKLNLFCSTNIYTDYFFTKFILYIFKNSTEPVLNLLSTLLIY